MDAINKIYNWVVANGYSDVHDWAKDSDYRRYRRQHDGEWVWLDSHGTDVDIWEVALRAMEVSGGN